MEPNDTQPLVDMLPAQTFSQETLTGNGHPANTQAGDGAGHGPQSAPLHKSVLRRVMTRDLPRPPFAGRKLGREEVERIVAVARDAGGAPDLRGADLREADLTRLDLSGAKLGDDDALATEDERQQLAARLDRAILAATNLANVTAPGVSFAGANLRGARLMNANLMGANFAQAYAAEADFAGARLTEADFAEARMDQAILAGAVLVGARFTGARLRQAHCEGADFGLANLAGADLSNAYCDDQTFLGGALLNGAFLDGLRYRETDLTAIDWSQMRALGEEHEAATTPIKARTAAFRVASRANRRLGLVLRTQGLTIESSRFLAQSRRLETRALWAQVRDRWQGRRYLPTLAGMLRWLMHTSEGMVTAYGEHPIWALGWAAGIAALFALLFASFAPGHPDLAAALTMSGSALLGRGYATVPGLLVAPGLMSFLSVLEAGIGTALMLLFVLALARKTQG